MNTRIFLPPEACAEVNAELLVWLVTAETSEALSFAEAQSRISGSWTLVLPVEVVTACAVNLPTRKARWLRQALPFAVEDILADDVELMHLALGEQLADGRHRVYAVRKNWLAGWLSACTHAPQAIAVDADLLPHEGCSLLMRNDRCLLGGESAARLAFSLQDWEHLGALVAQPVRAWHEEDVTVPADIEQRESLADSYRWLAQQPLRNNLAQGEFAVQSSNGQWQRFKPVAAVVILLLAMQWVFNLAQGWHLQRQADVYAEASEALYRELFPDDTRLVNVRAQFDHHLQGATEGGQSRMLNLLSQVSVALNQSGRRVEIAQVDFSEVRGDLAMQVVASGFADLEQLREHLQSSGLSVQLGSATREGEGVSARVVVGG
ncbi:type II secretion system protein GspL [Ectopseudomonas mendocina]|uniref:Type II secretion system protein L n=1 Tax=Ectopseudomonas mendocina TaxID=300 RepID=A0ABZ2RCC9_ECTME